MIFLFFVPFIVVIQGVFCSLFFVAAVSAVEVVNLPNPLGTHDIPTLLGRIIKGFLSITGSIALIMFVYGGITWLTSAGNADKIKKGKDVFLWSVVGIAIIFSSYLLVDFVISGITKGGKDAVIKKCQDTVSDLFDECN